MANAVPSRLLRRSAVVLGVLTVAVVLEASAGAGQEGQTNPRGQDLYAAQCALCHGEMGRGIEGTGPPLVGVGAASVDFMLRTGRMPLPHPDARMTHEAPKVTDEQREDLIAYITGLSDDPGPPIPAVDPAAGDLSRGRELFTHNCAACHGPTAAGIAVGQRDIAPDLDEATALEIAEAVRTGPGVMPVFSEDVYDQHDLDSVVAWVLDLRDRATPGGAHVGRSGPVFEGAVAWILGLGLLLIVIYLLGERTEEGGVGEHDG
ncbi:MAG: c-type cytochrome [Actinobacteria bacterium]|nr:c-type cytochrome [Actinomycetota bacterium]